MSEEIMNKEIAAKLILENKKVKLMPIPKPGGMFPAGHDGEFMFTGTAISFVVPYDVKHNRYPTI